MTTLAWQICTNINVPNIPHMDCLLWPLSESFNSISLAFSNISEHPHWGGRFGQKSECRERSCWYLELSPQAVDSSGKGAGDLECLGALVFHSCISLPVSEGNGQMMDDRRERQKIVCLQVYESLKSDPSPLGLWGSPDLYLSRVALQLHRDGNSNPEMMSWLKHTKDKCTREL